MPGCGWGRGGCGGRCCGGVDEAEDCVDVVATVTVVEGADPEKVEVARELSSQDVARACAVVARVLAR